MRLIFGEPIGRHTSLIALCLPFLFVLIDPHDIWHPQVPLLNRGAQHQLPSLSRGPERLIDAVKPLDKLQPQLRALVRSGVCCYN